MHRCTTPVQRTKLVDPAACGVRLGVELRAAAEQEAYRSGMCLSHWIKKVVQEAVSRTISRQPESVKGGKHSVAQLVSRSERSDLSKSQLFRKPSKVRGGVYRAERHPPSRHGRFLLSRPLKVQLDLAVFFVSSLQLVSRISLFIP